jgi:hypothetical protein
MAIKMKIGCIEASCDNKEMAGKDPRRLLLPGFVIHEYSNLRLAGSDSYLTEVFPRYQYGGHNRRYNDGGDQDRLLLLHGCFSLPFGA